ncbi:MAG: hypothetical protein QGG53_43265 [Planctomycetota bacterium]|jgi:hypothetical protein|nr:hypothetical protein [Planctomycetota bacterium]
MSVKPRYPKEEFTRLGTERFMEIKDQFTEEDKGKYLVIDIESGDYELDEDEIEACLRLRVINPDAQLWSERIGYRARRFFGGVRR